MRTAFDQFAKHIVQSALAPSCAVRTEVEIAPEVQKADAWIEPDPARAGERARAGLLGRMADAPCLLEPFHHVPGVADVRACVLKQLALDARRRRDARRADAAAPAFPALWVVATGRPETALREFELRPLSGWPSGCYEASPAWAVRVVVVRELPRDRTTLLVRLLGADEVLRHAVADLRALPTDAWERQAAAPALVLLRLTWAETGGQAEGDRELAMDANQVYQEWLARVSTEAQRQERAGEVQRLFTKRLGRALTESESATLAERLERLGVSRLEDVVLELRADALAAWLADPSAT